MKVHSGSLRSLSTRGFSLAEVLVTLAILAILAGVGFVMISGSKVSVVDTKIRTGVVRLNQIISLNFADGGSWDALTTAQAVVEKLKTVRTNADAKRLAGALTGCGVDGRLTSRAQAAAERVSATPRATISRSTPLV